MENGQEIVLTEFNETLSVRKPRTDDSIDGAYADLGIGIHKICKSTICCREVSETHRAIFCKGCGLRIVAPNEVDTYEKLAAWCQEQIRQRDREIVERDVLRKRVLQLEKQLLIVRRQLDLVP